MLFSMEILPVSSWLHQNNTNRDTQVAYIHLMFSDSTHVHARV